jgi:hypothetical protein
MTQDNPKPDDIDGHRTVDSAVARESVALLSDRNRQVLESARAVEARKGRSRKVPGGGGNEAEAGMGAPGAASAPGTSSGTLF